MSDFPLLSAIVFVPALGALLLLFVPGTAHAAIRWIALLTALVTLGLSLALLGYDPGGARVPVPRGPAVDRVLRHALHARRRRHQRRARDPDDAAERGGDRLQLGADPDQGQGLLRRDAAAHGRHDRRLREPRPLPLLRLLGSQPLPDVLPHRHLGRPAPHLRHGEVRHLHPGRVAPHARRDPGGGDRARSGRQPVHVQLRGAARLRLHRYAPGPRLHRVLPGLRHQGADVAAPHVAARRPRRGANGRLDHPGRACCSSSAATGSCATTCRCCRTRRRRSRRSSSAWRWWRSSTARWWRWCSRT